MVTKFNRIPHIIRIDLLRFDFVATNPFYGAQHFQKVNKIVRN